MILRSTAIEDSCAINAADCEINIAFNITAPESVGLSADGLRLAFQEFKKLRGKGGNQPLPGGVMIVSRFGRIAFADAWGVTNLETSKPMQVDGIFNLASMTKTVTAIATMILYDEGKLGLDDPISKWFPEFIPENIVIFKDNGSNETSSIPISIRHLLTHTAGFTYGVLFKGADKSRYLHADSAMPSLLPQLQDFQTAGLAFEPGTKFRYGGQHVILGLVIEAISGKSLFDFFQERIFKPLGMWATYGPLDEDELQRFAPPWLGTKVASTEPDLFSVLHENDSGSSHIDTLSKVPGPIGEGGQWPAVGDVGLLSTPADWEKLAQVLLNQGRPLMSENTYKTMTTVQTPVLNGDFNTHLIDRPQTGGRMLFSNYHAMPGGGIAFNLAGEAVVSPMNPYGASHGSYGWEGLYSTKFLIDPIEKLSIHFYSTVAPCWRYDIKGALFPLIYRALLTPIVPHHAAFKSPTAAVSWSGQIPHAHCLGIDCGT